MKEIFTKTKLAFNVGITGHRNITAEEKLIISENIHEILYSIKEKVSLIHSEKKDIYSEESPELRLITSLAEGTDRFAAEIALDEKLNYIMQCPLPLNQNDYLEDFITEDSKRQFKELLSKASAIMEIDWGRDSRPICYLDIGLIMLEQIDILIAVWDGKEPKGVGGTADIVRRAETQGIPVLWLDRTNLGNICYINMSARYYVDWKLKLNEYIDTVLIPMSEDTITISDLLDTFHKEDLSSKKSIKLYSRVVKLLSWTKEKKTNNAGFTILAEQIKGYYDKDTAEYVNQYLKNYERADELALYYADIYRSASFMRALLPFMATLALGLGFYWNWGDPLTIVNSVGFFLQALLLAVIIFLSNKNERLKWHKKFIDYRILAELFRQIIYISPIGYSSRGIRDTGDETSWYKWYYRNIIRSTGLPSIKLDMKNMNLYLTCVTNEFIKNQINYHEDRIKQFKRISKRLNKIGFLFLGLGIFITVVRGIVYFLIQGKYIPKELFGIKVTPFFNMLSMILPAVGAVMFTILAQCGFESLEQKHNTMKSQLKELDNESQFTGNTYMDISSYILRVANIAINEVSDWRLFLKSKSIKKT